MDSPLRILGGNATLYVRDFEAAVAFYTKTLGLRLVRREGDDWAEVRAGDDLVIGLHPARPGRPKPGSVGAVQLGLHVEGPMEAVVERLRRRGVAPDGPIVRAGAAASAWAQIQDMDGNRIYLWERPIPRTSAATARPRVAARR